jgi:glycine cleavage system aminomethyltransferase T
MKIWNAIFEAGKPEGIKLLVWRKRYTSLGNGILLYGNDLDDTTSPIEAGWVGLPSLQKVKILRTGLILKAKMKE